MEAVDAEATGVSRAVLSDDDRRCQSREGGGDLDRARWSRLCGLRELCLPFVGGRND